MRIICTDNVEVGIESYGLIADFNENNDIKSVWSISVEDGKVKDIKSFPVNMLQSFYAHSSGMISCNIPCPEFIAKEMNNRSAQKLFSDKEKLSKLFGLDK